MKKKLDQRLIVFGGIAVLAVVVAVGGFLTAVEPQLSKSTSLDSQIQTAQLEFASLHSGNSKTPAIHAAELFQLARAMPDDADVPGALLDLARAAQASSATLVAVQPTTPVVQSDGATALPFNVTVNGSWTTVTAFLHDLRQQVQLHGQKIAVSGRLFDVDKISILTGQQNQGSEVQALLTLEAFTYGTAKPASTTTTGTSTTATTTTSSSPPSSAQAAGAGGGS